MAKSSPNKSIYMHTDRGDRFQIPICGQFLTISQSLSPQNSTKRNSTQGNRAGSYQEENIRERIIIHIIPSLHGANFMIISFSWLTSSLTKSLPDYILRSSTFELSLLTYFWISSNLLRFQVIRQ